LAQAAVLLGLPALTVYLDLLVLRGLQDCPDLKALQVRELLAVQDRLDLLVQVSQVILALLGIQGQQALLVLRAALQVHLGQRVHLETQALLAQQDRVVLQG